MKILRFILFVTLIMFIGTLLGCQCQQHTTAEMEAIDYSLYGPLAMDITNQ